MAGDAGSGGTGSLRVPRGAALALLIPAALCGCDTAGRVADNRPPHVEITGSPVEGDSINYVVDLFWHGWDDDGEISHSEYAVDIPGSFTAEQIADPNTPGIQWTTTKSHAARLRFPVASPESPGTLPAGDPGDRASAPHTFFVRVYDNEGAHSAVAERSFNAWTALPRTTIIEPARSVPLPYLAHPCPSLTVRFGALDPDGPGPERRPARTEYRLISVRTVLGITDANLVVHQPPGPSDSWLPVPGDPNVVTVTLTRPASYVLALRSIDEAGGIESRFEFWRNALLIQASGGSFPGSPTLRIHEPLLGTITIPADGQDFEREILAGQPLSFTITSDATAYGGSVNGVRWCVDSVSPPTSLDTPAGCSAWGLTTALPPILFATPGVHSVSFAAQFDRSLCSTGIFLAATCRLIVVPRSANRDVLYVDDINDPATDSETDRRFLNALRGAGFDRVDTYSTRGEGDTGDTVHAPTLTELSRYRLLFWAVDGAGGTTRDLDTALLRSSECPGSRVLRSYVAGGGAVWIHGSMVFGALHRSSPAGTECEGSRNDAPYRGLDASRGDFIADYLRLTGGDVRNVGTAPGMNALLRAEPTAAALASGLPSLEADSMIGAVAELGGLPSYDAAFETSAAPVAGLEELYTAETVDPLSPFDRKPIAWRFSDPEAGQHQGPVVVTSFPLHYLAEGSFSQVVAGAHVPGTGLNGLVEALGAWFRALEGAESPVQ